MQTKNYKSEVKKWFTQTTYVDIETGEIINNLTNYIKIKCEKKHRVITQVNKGINEKIGETQILWTVRKHEQTKLEI